MTPASLSPAAETRRARAGRLAAGLLAAGMAAIGLAVGAFGWSLQPPEGDLVRISGASSREFGWRGEATGFAEDHRRELSLAALLRGADPGEVLVFGDSFSIRHAGGVSWINTLHEATGLEVAFVRVNDFAPALRYLRSEAFAARPPKAVIVQTVERALLVRAVSLRDPAAPCEAPPPPAPVAAAPEAPLALPRRVLTRRTAFESFDELMSWGALAARLRLTGGEEPVLEARLTRTDLFSHAAADRVLLLGADVRNQRADVIRPADPAAAAEAVRCGLRRLAAAAEGRAPLWLMIAPDKRTVYAPWIADRLAPPALDLYAVAHEALGPALIDPLPALRATAEAGVRDVHFPDDSHWGPRGHALAGTLAARALTGAE